MKNSTPKTLKSETVNKLWQLPQLRSE